jgi:hypothetical protein
MSCIVANMSKTTILIETTTREKLREVGKKNQTYDQLINELIKSKRNQDPLDSMLASLKSSGSPRP